MAILVALQAHTRGREVETVLKLAGWGAPRAPQREAAAPAPPAPS